MKYQLYRTNLERQSKIAREHGAVKSKGEQAIQDTMRMLFKRVPQMTKTMDFIIQAEEFWWLKSGRVMFYPETLALTQSMMRAKVSVGTEAAFYDGNEVFMLNFPTGFELGGAKASGALVSVARHEDRGEAFIHDFAKWSGLPPVEIHHDWEGRGIYTISVNYQHPADPIYAYSRFVLNSNWLPELAQITEVAGFESYMQAHNEFSYSRMYELDRVDSAYQFDLIRVILNFLLYKKAMPHRIRDGLPGVSRKEVETPTVLNRTHKVIGLPDMGPREVRGERTPHYRSWHFRQLKDPRFYKGEHEGKPIGSRVIMVADTYIGKASPKTVEAN